MAQHGYLGEGYGLHGEKDLDFDRDRDRERGWREREDRGFMFEDRDRFRERGDDRWRGSDSDEWFGGRERGSRRMSRYGPEHGFGGSQGDYDQGRRFSSHPDDHYLSWREKQMRALDREYADYCREREQQFHREFDSWRQNRQQQGSAQPGGRSETPLELDNPTALSGDTRGASTPVGDATLGTNNPENSTPGRGGRR